MISFDELITSVTEDQFLEKFLDNLETIGLKARSWRPAGVYRTILRVLAATCGSLSDQQVQFIKSGFLELAEGKYLTWVAFYVYGEERPSATFASGQVTLTNNGGGDYTWTAGQLRVFNPTTKKRYTNEGDVHLGPLATIPIDVIASEIGSASSSAAATITGVETQFDDLEVTNALPVVGSDEMSDDDLRQLCKDKIAAQSVFGPRGAYRYAVRSAKRADGSAINVNRVSISPASSNGTVTTIIASPSGIPDPDDVDLARENVDLIARNDVATSVLNGATAHPIARTLTIWAKKQTGLAAADILALAQKQLIAFNRDYPIGGIRKGGTQGFFWADSLDGAVQAAHPSIFSVDGLGADEAMASGEVLVAAVVIDTVRIVDTEVH